MRWLVSVALLLAPLSARAADTETSLRHRGMAQYDEKKYAECAATMDSARALSASDERRREHAYAAACCYALAGKPDVALERLQLASDLGFTESKQLEGDEDLASLRKDPRWGKLLAAMKEREAKYLASINAELKALFDADQADRQSDKADWRAIGKRDEERRAKVAELLAKGGAKVADDYLHAAMVFQHGQKPADYQRANELALKAVELDPKNMKMKWLVAATKDRWLFSQGKPQLYGTQSNKVNGVWTVDPVDPTITDEERAKWGVPPLAEAKARAEQMNKMGQ